MKLWIPITIAICCAFGFAAQDDTYYEKWKRHDPFTFALKPRIIDPPPATQQQNSIDVEKKTGDATQLSANAQAALIDRRIEQCIAQCDAALNSLKDVSAGR